MDAYWRACNYLSVGMIYLQDNPLLKEPLRVEHVKHRLLGHWGASPALSFVWVHLNRLIRKDDLDVIFVAGPGPRRAGRPRTGVPRGHLLRDLSGQEPGRGGHAQVLQAVLLPRAHRQPRHTGDAGLHSRRRRARVQPLARVRDGVRQPGCDRRVRRRRRRGGDGSARDGVAFQQVREPGPRRRGPADPEPERLQDRQPDPALAHQPRRARGAVRRLRLYAVLRRGQRPGRDAPEDGGDAGGSDRRHPRGSESRARIQDAVPAALADDRAPVAERVDRACGDQGSQGGRLVAIASGPVLRRA